MRNRLRMMIIAAIIGVSSCNLPASQTTEMPASTPSPVLDTPTSSILTFTPIPIETLINVELPTSVITPSSTPSVFLASPKDQPVNCRYGPATSYAVIGALNLGAKAEMIGRNADSTWWYVRNPTDPSTSCWLSAEFVQTVGDVQSLPVVTALENMVTGIQVRVDPPVINVACDALPQVVSISAQITASGPATVVWHWQLSTGVVSPDKQILFEAGDTKTVQDYYEVRAINDYIVQVQTTLPNIMTGQSSFKVVCTP
ncbi:MAG TPA: SH3 domain-containing protein [Anaerolineales bacterium]|nr:SH3 domain-containing protein [Anaerolineales bacterium]